MISTRGTALVGGEEGILFAGFNRAHANAFNATTNPTGIINLGTAENTLNGADLTGRLRGAAAAAITPESMKYNNHQGTLELRTAVAGLFTAQVAPLEPVLPKHVSILNGAGTVLDTLFQVLCDPGDGVLLPTPYYGAFDQDLGKRAQARILPVDTHSHNGFQLQLAQVHDAYARATEQGIRVRVLLLSNPNNPLGVCYPEALLHSLLCFAEEKNLHFVSDEIYMLSNYAGALCSRSVFKSALALPQRRPELVHIVWAFSKDFCVSGYRTGVLITRNTDVSQAIESLSYFTGVPVNTQFMLAEMISNQSWTHSFINTNRERLAHAYRFLQDRLKRVGIFVAPANSGFFIWIDLRPYLREPTFKAEIELWDRLLDKGLYIAPGLAFHCVEPGWFRIVTAAPDDVLGVAIDRLEQAVAGSARL